MAIKAGIKTTEFWSTVAVWLTGVATLITTLFNQDFLTVHPLVSGLVAGGALVLTGLAQSAYSVSRGLAKSGYTETDTAVAV